MMTFFFRCMGMSSVFAALCLSVQEIHESKDDFLVQSLDASYARGIEYLASSQGSDGMWTEILTETRQGFWEWQFLLLFLWG